MSVWGVVALIGILVNDAVVMLDKYNKENIIVEIEFEHYKGFMGFYDP